MTILNEFSPPAHLSDFDSVSQLRDAWSEMMSASFDQTITCIENPTPESPCGRNEVGVGTGNCQLFNPTKVDTPEEATAVEVIWLGYPRRLTVQNGEEAGLQIADDLHPLTDFIGGPSLEALGQLVCRGQDEYCEWHVTYDEQTGKILRVTFTCEAPEYWSALAGGYPSKPFFYEGPQTVGATGDPKKLLALYRELVSEKVQLDDLFFQDNAFACPDQHQKPQGFLKGQYNPYNKWNTTEGVVHLTHPSNRLLAEIQLTGDGSVSRSRDGVRILEADQLICCVGHAGPNRSSDPHIMHVINQLARNGAMITLKDPVGVYMDSLNTVGWTKPDGHTPVGDYWKVIRGAPDMTLRAIYEVPEDEGFTVSDILIAGVPIRHAGQIAQQIKMKLTGIVFMPKEPRQPRLVPCNFRCGRKKDNPAQLKLVEVGGDCPEGFELGSPGIPVLTAVRMT